jgi:hypothetical protein
MLAGTEAVPHPGRRSWVPEMAQVPATAASQSRYSSGLYDWLLDREERSARSDFVLADRQTGTSYNGFPDRLATLRAGCAVNVAVGDLPPHVRFGLASHWWNRATVSPDGSIGLSNDQGEWLRENGL